MAQSLEWFQCRKCGRRHRWRAEIAGTEIECPCGEMVFCPEIDVFGAAEASDTPVDMDAIGAGEAMMMPAGEASDHFPAEIIPVEGEEVPAGEFRYQRKRGTGLFGMGPFGEMVLWLVGAAAGFALVVHAIVLQWRVYIVATVIWAPISFVMFWRKKKRWQGNRSLMRAIEEEFDGD